MDVGRWVETAAAETGELEAILEDLEEEHPFLTAQDALESMAEMVAERTALLRYNSWVFTPVPRSVSECLETSTATPLERCAIVVACCRVRSLHANIVVPARWENLSRDVPVVEELGDLLVRVSDLSSPMLWVDPVDGTVVTQSPPVPGGFTYFDLKTYGAERKMAGNIFNHIGLSIFWDLEEGEARAEGRIGGPIARTLGWKEPEKLVSDWAEGWCDSAEVTDLKIMKSGPEWLHFVVSLDAPLPEADDRGRISLDLPLPPLEMTSLLPEGLDLARSETDGVLFFPAPTHAEMIWKIKPPEGLKIFPNPSVEAEWEDGSVAIRREGHAPLIVVRYDLNLGGRPIIPAEYGGYRSLFLEATDPGLTRLVFAEEEEEE